MYGRFSTFSARPGRRDDLAAILMRAAALVGALAGCHLYLVATAPDNGQAIQIIEVWDDVAAHAASLDRPQVRALIAEAMPLLAGPPDGGEMMILGGHGLEL
ncbi:MAG: antibiotic biosynthesis monooxygenase [Candidatus Promineifilaceae bacterium]|nr:antibiotic biosynthesis monooxygenase [Candidatus Promineifilaceae bacterium]